MTTADLLTVLFSLVATGRDRGPGRNYAVLRPLSQVPHLPGRLVDGQVRFAGRAHDAVAAIAHRCLNILVFRRLEYRVDFDSEARRGGQEPISRQHLSRAGDPDRDQR